MQGGRTVRAAIDTARQPLQPAGADMVDREVSRYLQGCESSEATGVPRARRLQSRFGLFLLVAAVLRQDSRNNNRFDFRQLSGATTRACDDTRFT